MGSYPIVNNRLFRGATGALALSLISEPYLGSPLLSPVCTAAISGFITHCNERRLDSSPTMAVNGRGIPDAQHLSAADAGNSITQHGFKITTRKLPILKAGPIEEMTTKLGIAPPEMIFGDNMVSIEHRSGWAINFNTYDALDRVDKSGESMLQVAHSREWQSTRYGGLEIY